MKGIFLSTTYHLITMCFTTQVAMAQRQDATDREVGTIDKSLRHTIQELLNQRGDGFVDPCASAPCLNAGKCAVTSYLALTYACHCIADYTGLRCERGLNECLSSPCRHGTCMDRIGSFSCRCHPGFTGLLCDQDVDECASSPCLNGGTCDQSMPGRFSCNCHRGFRGARCQTDIDECLSLSPCQNGGVCRQEGPGDYSCGCLPGFSGKDCEQLVDPCASSPCHSSGQCVHNTTTNTWHCQCSPGFAGMRCEQEINACLVQSLTPCGQGVCQPLPGNQYRCQCPPGTTGRKCGTEVTEVNQCTSSPCQNDGRCVNVDGGRYRCQCRPNFKGTNCQNTRSVCDVTRVRCQNGGSCVTTERRRPRCLCSEGFSGPRCESELDPCVSRPCVNRATCQKTSGSNEFHCTCQTGFSGPTCHSRTEVGSAITTLQNTESTFITVTTTSNVRNTTEDGDHVHMISRPIDPTTLFVLLGILGTLALIIGGAYLFLKLIGRRKPRDYCLALPWSLFNGLEPRLVEEWSADDNRGAVNRNDACQLPSMRTFNFNQSQRPKTIDLGDYTFRRY